MIRYRAAWVLPIAEPPIRDGWVTVDGGRVVAFGRRAASQGDGAELDLGHVALMPALANAHTHLELSYLRDEVPPSSDFIKWIRDVMSARRARPDPSAYEILTAVDGAIDEAVRFGTVLIGDISNTLVTFGPLARSPLAGVLFYELIRFNTPDPDKMVDAALGQLRELPPSGHIRTSLAAHAPYSVAPLLFRAIRRAADRDPFLPWSVHLAESTEEMEFVRSGGGAWRALLEELGVWDPAWVPPGGTPVEYLADAGLLDARVLAVHGVHMTDPDLERIAAAGTTVVTCPRSNGHTGAGAPPLEDFYASRVRVAVGTDSLASTPDLNVFAELATMRALAPSVPASSLLDSATRQGARALGFEAEYGTIEPGKAARLIAVDVPAGTDDVEEYLVTGIQAEQIHWVEEEARC